MRAFLVDDEPLALKRLRRMLAATGRVEITGESSDPEQAIHAIESASPDVLFLDMAASATGAQSAQIQELNPFHKRPHPKGGRRV